MVIRLICLSFILFIYFSISALAQDNILSEIKNIDNQMNQGNIDYTRIESLKNRNIKYRIYYNGEKYKRSYSENNFSLDNYFDGEKPFSVTKLSDGKDQLTFTAGDSIQRVGYSFLKISNGPSVSYGRGLSQLSNVSYNPEKMEVTGNLKYDSYHYKVVAKIEPKYQYLAYETKLYDGKNQLVETIVNSKPTLIDGKFYIYANSEVILDNNTIIKVKINSATFKKPDEKDYTYDIEKKNPQVVDGRTTTPIIYESMPKGVTMDELAEITKKHIEEQARINADRVTNDGINPNLLWINIVAVLIFISIFAGIVIKVRKKTNKSN